MALKSMKIQSSVLILCFYILFESVAEIDSEFFTSQEHMKELLITESEIFKALETYLEMEEQRLHQLKQLREDYSKLHSSVSRDGSSFLFNPVNAFLLVKRLTSDWNSLKALITGETSRALIESVSQQLYFPDRRDLNGAAIALMRLQDIYLLKTSDMAQGRIRGARSTLELTDSSHAQSLENQKLYMERLQEQGGDESGRHDEEEASSGSDLYEYSDFKRLCRGEKLKSDAEEKHLHCRYFTNGSPYLLLQPVKEETVNLDPPVRIYYDVLSDKEIDIIKRLSLHTLERSVVEVKPQENGVASVRESKTTALEDEDDAAVARLTRTVASTTGLDLNTAELLHVTNYGIGGHYEPHHDSHSFASLKGHNEGIEREEASTRIATWTSYMSDVDAGGFTVFPIIGVSVKPIKGSAVFWYNTYLNGEGDPRLIHGACPVLAGSKWISTKWIDKEGQEFRRKCSLDKNA